MSAVTTRGQDARAAPHHYSCTLDHTHTPSDIHATEEMAALVEKAAAVLPVEHLWVNPDCGLKTRAWPEVKEALVNLVACARALRARYAKSAERHAA